MEVSPRKSRSLTFEIPMLGSSYPPTMNFVATENSLSKDSILAFGSKCIRSNVIPHTFSKDAADDDQSFEKTKINVTTSNVRSQKTILDGMMGMFGSVKSFVRKLPNVVPNLDDDLPVAVVSNGDIIPSRDLYVNIPLISRENIQLNTADMELNGSMTEDNNSESPGPSNASKSGRKFIPEIFSRLRSNLPHKRFFSTDNIYRQTWVEQAKYPEEMFVDVAFEAACEESLGNNLFSGNVESKILVTQARKMEIGGEDFDLLDLSCPNSVPETVNNVEMIQEESLENPKSILKRRTSIECKFSSKTQQVSESSAESDDSFIVFEEFSSECSSEHCSTSGDEDDDNDSDDDSYGKFAAEFTSKSDFRSRRYSESSDDSDDSDGSIVFEENSPSKCSDVKFSEEFCSWSNERINSKVRFDPKPQIHPMIKWNYAYRAARKGPWEEIARDRERFQNRINSTGRIINPILTAEHRQSIQQSHSAFQD